MRICIYKGVQDLHLSSIVTSLIMPLHGKKDAVLTIVENYILSSFFENIIINHFFEDILFNACNPHNYNMLK